MPISPKNYIDSAKKNLESIVKQKCEEIDKDLTISGVAIFDGINAYSGPNAKQIQSVIVKKIKALYCNAGWEVSTVAEYTGVENDDMYSHDELCCLAIYIPNDRILKELESK